MKINWLTLVTEFWAASLAQDRIPHALMLVGIRGTGKRSAAAWLARKSLNLVVDAEPKYPLEIPQHADIRWVRPAENKKTIGIDQIRELVAELSLTSYEGVGKVAVIEPADSMTSSAANGLLKTLEEPAGNTLLILVVDRQGHIPATIYSRCHRLKISVPSEDSSLVWLKNVRPGTDWRPLLWNVGGAPLAAVEEFEQIDDTEVMAEEFLAIGAGKTGPLEIAAKWSKYEPDFVLGWLSRQIQRCITSVFLGTNSDRSPHVGDYVLNNIDRRNLFCYLDMINRLKSQPVGSYNAQLALECLLIDWYQGLESLSVPE